MSDGELPDAARIVKYIRPRLVGDGKIEAEAFKPRASDIDGLSVNWLDVFDPPKANQLTEVKNRARITMSSNGLLAELRVGDVRRRANEEKDSRLIFVHDPLDATSIQTSDPSHSLKQGIPNSDPDEVPPICDLIADCVLYKHETT